MVKRLGSGSAVALLALAFLSPARADEPAALPALTFDAVNTPLAAVVERAKAAGKPIFIDFFLDG